MGEIADDIMDGWICSHCGRSFVDPHGFPVLCKDCWKHETPDERAGLPKATNAEVH